MEQCLQQACIIANQVAGQCNIRVSVCERPCVHVLFSDSRQECERPEGSTGRAHLGTLENLISILIISPDTKFPR
jgi:hypothetical protein